MPQRRLRLGGGVPLSGFGVPIYCLVFGLMATEKLYPSTRQNRRDKSIRGDTTAAQHSSLLEERQLAFHLHLDSRLRVCEGLAEPLVSWTTLLETHPGADEVILKWWYFLMDAILLKCGAKKSVQLKV